MVFNRHGNPSISDGAARGPGPSLAAGDGAGAAVIVIDSDAIARSGAGTPDALLLKLPSMGFQGVDGVSNTNLNTYDVVGRFVDLRAQSDW